MMSAHLTTAKRLLTLYGNKLEQTVERFKEEGLESLHAEYGVGSQAVNQDKLRKLEEALGAVESLMAQLEATLTKFVTLLDMSPATDQDEVDKYSIRAEESLAIAVDFMMLLQARIRALKSSDSMIHPQVAAHQSFSEGPARVAQVRGPRPVELPTLPIPKFNGNIWDWDNFWELFNANVHSQELPELLKFNYLLDALQGEAKESVRKFQVTADNYSRAITFLHNRYGSKEELIQKLINRLENFHLRSHSLKDQCILFEQIQVIIQQLRQKGEQVDSQWMMKKILSKFPERFQRKVLAKKRSTPLSLQPISMQGLFDLMEDVLSAEEMFQVYLQEQRETPSIGTHSQKAVRSRKMLPCMYCKGDHKPAECGKFKTPQQRAQYLRERNLCQLCASAHHATSDCSRQPCFRCKGPHHTSCCFKSTSTNTSSMQFTRGNTKEPSERPEKRTEKKQAKTATKINLVADDNSSSENDEGVALEGHDTGTVLGIQPSSDGVTPQKTFLPIGEVSVVDPKLMNLRRVQVLVDTGAEMSFIETALAQELNLPSTEEKQLCYYTFGSKEVQKAPSRRVQLPVWDNDGQLHTLDLLTSDIFAKGFAVPPLSKEDSEVLQSLNMQLPSQRRQVKPGILLGSDQAWQFLRKNCSQVQLPSGLHVLPTTLGDILTGQLKSPQRILHVRPDNESEEIIQWDKYWSLEPQVNMVQENKEPSDDEDDENKWEKYWQLETAGIHEFGNPEEEEKARLDKQVWDNFNRTIKGREEGYYVKLPWKDDHPELPDNHAIAVRLYSVWETLQKDQNLLQRYDAVFQEQKHEGQEGTTDEDNGCSTSTSTNSSVRCNLRQRGSLPATSVTLNLVATIALIFCLFISGFGHTTETKSIEISSPLSAITSLRKFRQDNNFQDFKFKQVSERNSSAVKYISSNAFNSRLEPRDQEGGPKYLHRMVIESKPAAQRLENDLMSTFNEIHNQVFVSTSIRSDCFHHMCSATLREMGVAERVQHLNHFLLNASLTKKRLLRFGTQFVLTDRIYESHAKADEELATSRKEWLQKEDVQNSSGKKVERRQNGLSIVIEAAGRKGQKQRKSCQKKRNNQRSVATAASGSIFTWSPLPRRGECRESDFNL